MLSSKGDWTLLYSANRNVIAEVTQRQKIQGIPAAFILFAHGPVLYMRVTLEETNEQRSLLLSNRSLLRGMRHSAVTMEALVRTLRNANPGVSKRFSLNTHPDTTNTHHQSTQAAFCLQAQLISRLYFTKIGHFSKVLYNLEGNQQRYNGSKCIKII